MWTTAKPLGGRAINKRGVRVGPQARNVNAKERRVREAIAESASGYKLKRKKRRRCVSGNKSGFKLKRKKRG